MELSVLKILTISHLSVLVRRSTQAHAAKAVSTVHYASY